MDRGWNALGDILTTITLKNKTILPLNFQPLEVLYLKAQHRTVTNHLWSQKLNQPEVSIRFRRIVDDWGPFVLPWKTQTENWLRWTPKATHQTRRTKKKIFNRERNLLQYKLYIKRAISKSLICLTYISKFIYIYINIKQ